MNKCNMDLLLELGLIKYDRRGIRGMQPQTQTSTTKADEHEGCQTPSAAGAKGKTL